MIILGNESKSQNMRIFFFQIRAGKSLKVSCRIASEFTNQERDIEKVDSLSD